MRYSKNNFLQEVDNELNTILEIELFFFTKSVGNARTSHHSCRFGT